MPSPTPTESIHARLRNAVAPLSLEVGLDDPAELRTAAVHAVAQVAAIATELATTPPLPVSHHWVHVFPATPRHPWAIRVRCYAVDCGHGHWGWGVTSVDGPQTTGALSGASGWACSLEDTVECAMAWAHQCSRP